MKMIRENLVPTLIILIAGLIVSFAVVPLQNTEWAESLRVESSEGGEPEGFGDGENAPPMALLIILPLVKVSLLMGIGGGLTALVFWIIRRVKRIRAGPAAA